MKFFFLSYCSSLPLPLLLLMFVPVWKSFLLSVAAQSAAAIDCETMPSLMDRKICNQAKLAEQTQLNKEKKQAICNECAGCPFDQDERVLPYLLGSDSNIKFCEQKCQNIDKLSPEPCEQKISCKIQKNKITFDCSKGGFRWLPGKPVGSETAEEQHCIQVPTELEEKIVIIRPNAICRADVDGHYCLDLICLQYYIEEGTKLKIKGPLERAVRKEYRMLSDEERKRFHSALQQMKRSGVYQKFVDIHQKNAFGTSAHSGPGFLPWHREYIKRFEFELRKIDPRISLPYWDTALDSRLANSLDSVLWSDELMGSTDDDGNLITGPFKNWKVSNFVTMIGNDTDRTLTQPTDHIIRKLGHFGMLLLNDASINNIVQQSQLPLFLSPAMLSNSFLNETMEWLHSYVHQFIGGHMSELQTSSNDPIFFLLHSFIDMLWENWRARHQNNFERERDYPKNFLTNQVHIYNETSEVHNYNENMISFGWFKNIHGLSNYYINNLYYHQSRPTCSYEQRDCGSKYLFCDVSHQWPMCVSKLRISSNCAGYQNGEDVCYNSACINNNCQTCTQFCNNKCQQNQMAIKWMLDCQTLCYCNQCNICASTNGVP